MTDPVSFMREALAEAAKGVGFTAPNPPVGAVVVREGVVVGRGHHAKAGGPHAEPLALRDAGEAARGAELYVTLEPCCTHGRTPPCTDAILAAGIARVHVGCTDPNPHHAGRAYGLLRDAGVEVVENVLREECETLIRAFSRAHLTGLPYLTLKLACSLDGRIADAKGNSQWITGPAARERVQALRREVDAVLVGTQTLRRDNPTLMPRPAHGHAPLRLVPDRRGRLPLSLNVFTDRFAARTLCLLGPNAPATRRKKLDALGVSWMDVPERREQLDWKRIFPLLAQQNLHHILCEGGGVLAADLLARGLVQELHWVQAPMLLGHTGAPAVAHAWSMKTAPRFIPRSTEMIGEDIWRTFLSAECGVRSAE